MELGRFGPTLTHSKNPDLADKSISELVAADPVATSRFIDNKLKAFLDFITSDADPIGKVTHYYYRREY